MPFIYFIAIFFFLQFHSFQILAENPPLPKLYRIGIIPDEPIAPYPLDIKKNLEILHESVSIALRQSNRFVVLNDEMIKKFWRSAHERSELEKEHELSCFFHMSVSFDEEHVTLIARVLSTKLELYLQETDQLERHKLASLSSDDLFKQTRELIYKLINRLPIDTYVTSIQGRYVTLSGGSLLGIYPSMEMDLYDVRIKKLHPANQSWLEFDKEKTGTIKIIEALEKTAVGVIQSATYEGSIKVGDSGKVSDSVSRIAFRTTKDPSKHQQSFELVSKETKKEIDKASLTSAADNGSFSFEAKEEKKHHSKDAMPFDLIMSAGHQTFSLASDSAKTSSKLGFSSLLNTITAKTIFVDHENAIDYDLKILLNFGSTKNSTTYFLTVLESALYSSYRFKELADALLHYGAKSAFNSYSIKESEVLGSSFVEMSLFSEASYNLTKDLNLGLGFELTPITFGSISLAASKESYKSGFDISYSLFSLYKNPVYFGESGSLRLAYQSKNLETKKEHVNFSFFDIAYQYEF